jgi:prepilin signal peptidase PulO-like enzyme (type II secretory pathway)
MYINLILYVFVFVLGLCIGSFLNCLIYRLEKEKSLKGRSFCPHCKHTLSWKDLVPVFSFLFLRGKCRYCKKNISFQYPLVEIATGVMFFLVFSLFYKFSVFGILNLVFLLYITSALIVLFIYDLKHYLIPDEVLFPAIVIAFIYRLIFSFNTITDYLLAVLIAAGFFLFIFIISKGKWMGFGDVKLAILMGLMLGFPDILAALFLAFFFGAIIGLIVMAVEKKSLKSEMPFGPFLIIGTFLALFWGNTMIQAYLKLFYVR